MEMLLDQLQANNILHDYDHDYQGQITKLFNVPSVCVQIKRKFPFVLIMDCTCEIDKYVLIASDVQMTYLTALAAFLFFCGTRCQ